MGSSPHVPIYNFGRVRTSMPALAFISTYLAASGHQCRREPLPRTDSYPLAPRKGPRLGEAVPSSATGGPGWRESHSASFVSQCLLDAAASCISVRLPVHSFFSLVLFVRVEFGPDINVGLLTHFYTHAVCQSL